MLPSTDQLLQEWQETSQRLARAKTDLAATEALIRRLSEQLNRFQEATTAAGETYLMVPLSELKQDPKLPQHRLILLPPLPAK